MADKINPELEKRQMGGDQFQFKTCECPADAWEVIVVNNDEYCSGRTTVYYHCSECGEDFAIVDFDTGEILNIGVEDILVFQK